MEGTFLRDLLVGGIAAAAAAVVVLLALSFRRSRRRRPPVPGAADDDGVRPATGSAAGPLRLLAALRRRLEELAAVDEVDAVALLELICGRGLAAGASDVHLTPLPTGLRVALRVDGLLYEVGSFRPEACRALLVRVKVLAKLDMYKRDTPQDGRFVLPGGEQVDVRVSLLPTIHGEKVVLRFLGRSALPYDLDTLGMDAETLRRYRHLCVRPQGLVLVTGPTGSGKTTTLYASLAAVREQRGAAVNIATIEDPVEYVLPYLSQTQVQERSGLTFAAGLRSLLRQDPNVIMVGEIRDRETAEIAMQAGLTGQLIFSTVHADSSPGVITRLLGMGVEPFVLASALAGVMSQRLVRRICPACITRVEPDSGQLEQIRRLGAERGQIEGPFWRGVGCEACLGLGVAGRTGLFELLEMNDELRDLMVGETPTQQFGAAALRAGMRPLLTTGLDQARAGIVALDDILALGTS